MNRHSTAVLFCLLKILTVASSAAQSPAKAPAPPSTIDPLPRQLSRTIIFIQTDCLHVPTPAELATLSPEEKAKWLPDAISKLKPPELASMKHDSHSGTGFIVFVPDPRLSPNGGFTYLVTNRHVIEPGIEDGPPCKVVGYSILLNKKGKTATEQSLLETISVSTDAIWVVPDDSAVDLAATTLHLDDSVYDFQTISLDLFASAEMIEKKQVVEGDPVLYAGLFIQYHGQSKLQPIVRSGTLAMMPSELINTTLKKPGHIYLAEAHVFGGNSGSPMLVDINKFTTLGSNYRFLGAVAGEVYESNDFSFSTSSTYTGNFNANSDISIVVPAAEVKDLVMKPFFQEGRDRAVALETARK